MKNVKRIDFVTSCANSDGNLVKGTERNETILFNQTVITSDEVRELIRSGEYEYDNRIIVTTPIRADNLKSR
ncbi:MAG: hypothetical protein J6R59_10090 [Paludibacteraceae bacterium]|nr:hypothetical protein [Paludibacteraceae bacterium]